MLKTAENDNENLTKLVSVIPQFIVKEKNKNNNSIDSPDICSRGIKLQNIKYRIKRNFIKNIKNIK